DLKILFLIFTMCLFHFTHTKNEEYIYKLNFTITLAISTATFREEVIAKALNNYVFLRDTLLGTAYRNSTKIYGRTT
ncbi:hypothetical protein ACJX0J_036455, partial [Zea mays]